MKKREQHTKRTRIKRSTTGTTKDFKPKKWGQGDFKSKRKNENRPKEDEEPKKYVRKPYGKKEGATRDEKPFTDSPGKYGRSKKYTFKKEDGPKKKWSERPEKGTNPNPPDYRLEKSNDRKGTWKKGGSKEKKSFQSRIKKPAAESTDGEIRLNRFIANAGVCSRREADKLIEHGLIKVNGKVVTQLGTQVKNTDSIKYNDKVIRPEKAVYVLLNKPKDFITTMEDPENRKTVMQLVEKACNERIYPVGRLDRNTTGLLLLTNDGELAVKLSHPSRNIKKLYQVDLDKPVSNEHIEKIMKGVELEDGKATVDSVAVVTPDGKSLGVELHSGKNRIVRRIFESIGYEVVRLDRVMYAGLTKKDLPRGRWRYLTEREVIRLKHFLK